MLRADQFLEKDLMLEITARVRKKEKPYMRWTDDIRSKTGHSVNDLKQDIVALISEKNIVKKRQRTNV